MFLTEAHMADWIVLALKWFVVLVAASPVVLGLGYAVLEGSILPRLIPRDEIEAMAEEVMRLHPEDPEQWAFMEEEAAWFRSHSFEQGKWHRIRKVIRRRLQTGDLPPSA